METLIEAPINVVIFFAGIFGLMVGSFFNVVIWRMPREESVVFPPSHCTRCGYKIKFYENIPVLSWLWLKGKCKSCGVSIGFIYPLVEIFTGICAALCAYYFLYHPTLYPLDFMLGMTFLILVSIPIFVIDFKHYLIPDVLVFPGMLIGLGLSFLRGGQTPLQSLLGLIGGGGFLWLIGFVSSKILKKEAMGFGDVKLLAMCGALFGVKTALLGLMAASFLGTFFGLPMMWLRRLNSERQIPFGPFICLGVMLAGFFAERFLLWYLGLGSGE